jgi:hypothetical protein
VKVTDEGVPVEALISASRHLHDHATEPGFGVPASSSPAAQGIATRQQARAVAVPADREVAQPSWPESPSRGEPGIPAPRTAVETGLAQPSARRDAAAALREPEAHAGTTAADMEPSAEALDDDPSACWPALNPRTSDQELQLKVQTSPDPGAGRPPGGKQRQSSPPSQPEPASGRNPQRPAAPHADWRDPPSGPSARTFQSKLAIQPRPAPHARTRRSRCRR